MKVDSESSVLTGLRSIQMSERDLARAETRLLKTAALIDWVFGLVGRTAPHRDSKQVH